MKFYAVSALKKQFPQFALPAKQSAPQYAIYIIINFHLSLFFALISRENRVLLKTTNFTKFMSLFWFKWLIDKLHNKGLLLEKRSEAFYLVLLRFLVSIHTTIGGRK